MDKKTKLLIETRNSEVFLRPRFTINLDENYEVLIARFASEFKKESTKIRGSIVDGHIFISVPKNKEHFWSPQLHLEILKEAEKKALLKGLFGPKPQVWTLFMFIHFVIGISFLGFCALFYTNYALKENLLFPIAMMIALPFIWIVLYFLGKIGKDTGKKQMNELHKFMIDVIKN